MSGARTYSIGGLADAAGVSRRTVRFYVERGLLPPPEGLGRGARYAGEHLARLLQIKEWQEEGVGLDEIRVRLRRERGAGRRAPRSEPVGKVAKAGIESRPPDSRRRRPPPSAPGRPWFRQPLVAGFELHVAAGKSPLTASQLAALASALNDVIEGEGETK